MVVLVGEMFVVALPVVAEGILAVAVVPVVLPCIHLVEVVECKVVALVAEGYPRFALLQLSIPIDLCKR